MDSRILKTIIEKFDGGPVGVTRSPPLSGEDAGTPGSHEPFLVQNGFLQRTPRGRVATAQAYRPFGFNPPSVTGGAQQSDAVLVDYSDDADENSCSRARDDRNRPA